MDKHGSPTEPKFWQAWLRQLRETRNQLRSSLRGKQRTHLRSCINERTAKAMAEFLMGRPTRMLEKVLKRRKEINLLLRLELPDGSLETDPSRIDTTAKQYLVKPLLKPPCKDLPAYFFKIPSRDRTFEN